MHLLVRETRSLDETAPAVDLGHAPADLIFLSFSDSDLTAAAAAWDAVAGEKPSLRLVNLTQLRHPMSVDLYVEQTVAGARAVVVRLLGGLDYWRYGAEEFFAVCRQRGIALALVPGDARDDAGLAALSTVPAEALARLDRALRLGGPENMRAALRYAAHLGGLGAEPMDVPQDIPDHGEHVLNLAAGDGPLAAIFFYRSQMLAGDIAPIEALAEALAQRGLRARAIFVDSLKNPRTAGFVIDRLREWRPAVVLNATGFSARQEPAGSPLDAADAPVLQLVLSGSDQASWAASSRGLSAADLAMQVVLPELDGRLLTTAISFKAEAAAPGLRVNRPDADGIALAADRAAGWARLATTPAAERRIAIVLSDYPGAGGQIGHAVGLDSFASLDAMLRDLRDAGYSIGEAPTPAELTAPPAVAFDYRAAFASLPAAIRNRIAAAWGPPPRETRLRAVRSGHAIIAVQPDRGSLADRKSGYHSADLPPCHDYVGFYLWLRGVHAVVHLGTHGTLEWLPGKAAALGADCLPAVLSGGAPVIYPFIVNNPGEAAAAKRRLGAVTIGHLTPPLRPAGSHGAALVLERLIDEYAAADGLDRRRAALLRTEILHRADATGLLAESGAARDLPAEEALARLDAYLCDVKELQIGDGLHVFGRAPAPARRAAMLTTLAAACPGVDLAHRLDASAANETNGLLAALDGRFVAPGPAGAPSRGRADVLPTGRNLAGIDPRAVPTRSAMALAEKAAEDLLRRHRQDVGDWPRSLVIDVWGSATLRTGGESLALAFVLMGVRPVWDAGSARVGGIEILPGALLDRPRVDVTLRFSGLFRDVFEAQMTLFDSAVRALAARCEDVAWNPLSGTVVPVRMFGPAPGAYGAGDAAGLAQADRDTLGRAYLAASGDGFGARVAAADAFVHPQDHREGDLLDNLDQALHAGGFAAAAAAMGCAPALYHLDTAAPDSPRTRSLRQEIVRVVRGRAANPAWIAGMMRHATRGAAEIARSVEALHGFAALLPTRLDPQFDLLFDATLGDAAVDRFLGNANPPAHAAMRARFRDALARDLWRPRRNAVGAILAGAPP